MMVYHHSGQVKVQNRNWNLTLSVFWMMKTRRTPTPVSEAIAPPPSLRPSGCCPSGCTVITPSSCRGRREVSAPPFAVWKGGCFGGGLGQQARCDEHMAVVPVLARSCRLQGPLPPLLACLGR